MDGLLTADRVIWALVELVTIFGSLFAVWFLCHRYVTKFLEAFLSDLILCIPPQQVPGIPAEALHAMKRRIEELGFTELTGHYSPRLEAVGVPNYAIILVSPDLLTFAEVSYMRLPRALRFWMALGGGKNYRYQEFRNEFVTVWSNMTRFVTSDGFLKLSRSRPDDVLRPLMSRSPEELLDAHRLLLRDIVAQRGNPISFPTPEHYRRYYRDFCAIQREASRKLLP